MKFVNKEIIKILKQCRIATIPENIEDALKIIISKTEQIEIGSCYSILINHDRLFDFDIDFNYNINKLDVEILDINDKFIKVFSPVWEGWLPKACIQITKKL